MERANDTIKAKLRKAMQETGKGWITCLPAVMLSLHIQHNNTELSPFEILYDRPYRVPLINLKGDDRIDRDDCRLYEQNVEKHLQNQSLTK